MVFEGPRGLGSTPFHDVPDHHRRARRCPERLQDLPANRGAHKLAVTELAGRLIDVRRSTQDSDLDTYDASATTSPETTVAVAWAGARQSSHSTFSRGQQHERTESLGARYGAALATALPGAADLSGLPDRPSPPQRAPNSQRTAQIQAIAFAQPLVRLRLAMNV